MNYPSHLNDIRKGLDQRKVTLLTLFDYLSEKHKTVIDDIGTECSWYRVSTGVPQGSVLGPLLFAMFIKDLPAHMYHHCFHSKILKGIELMQQDTEAMVDWATENELELNLNKSKVMILGSEGYIASRPEFNIYSLPPIIINDSPLQYVKLIKNLGSSFTPTLNWSHYVNSILKKVHSFFRSLNFYRRALSIPSKRQLVLTLALPHFDYASVVFIDLEKTHTQQRQVAHNACIRFIFGLVINVSTHLTHKQLELSWLSLTGRRHLQLALLIYKTILTKITSYIFHSLTVRNNTSLTSISLRLPPRPFHAPQHLGCDFD